MVQPVQDGFSPYRSGQGDRRAVHAGSFLGAHHPKYHPDYQPAESWLDYWPGVCKLVDAELSRLEAKKQWCKREAIAGRLAGHQASAVQSVSALDALVRSAALTTAEPSSGLVIDSTTSSVVDGVETLEIDQHHARMSRMRARVREAACFHRAARRDWPSAMFTFTYGQKHRPKPSDISKLLKNFSNWFSRRLKCEFRYVWVAEIQEKRAKRIAMEQWLRDSVECEGNPEMPRELAGKADPSCLHYHLLVWLPPELRNQAVAMNARNNRIKLSGVLPKPDKKGWWKWGSTERDWCRTNPVSYISKYLSKGGELSFPKGFRVHGAGGFSAAHREARSYSARPSWLREITTPAQRLARAPGGGFFDRDSDEAYASPYKVLEAGSALVKVVKVCPKEFQQRLTMVKKTVARLRLLAVTASQWMSLAPSASVSTCF